MRILVVDDEEHLRRMMRLTLEAAGYEVAEAADGEEALRLFDDGFRFDATLLDQRMPGLDGLETLRRMKLLRADAPIIMVTAYGTIELAVDAMKLGATDFVRKPMTPDTLRQAVAAALAKRTGVPMPTGEEPVAAAPATPELSPPEIWTTNGFYIRRVVRRSGDSDQPSADHHFVVRRGKEAGGTDVVVRIGPKAVARLTKEARRNLSPAGAFWRRQAETALVNHLWAKAAVPDDGRLVIDAVSGRIVDEAIVWSGD